MPSCDLLAYRVGNSKFWQTIGFGQAQQAIGALLIGTNNQGKTETGWIKPKTNLECAYGLRLEMLNIETSLDKAEEELIKERKLDVLGLSQTGENLKSEIIHQNLVYISSGRHDVGIVVNKKTGKYVTKFESVTNKIKKIMLGITFRKQPSFKNAHYSKKNPKQRTKYFIKHCKMLQTAAAQTNRLLSWVTLMAT